MYRSVTAILAMATVVGGAACHDARRSIGVLWFIDANDLSVRRKDLESSAESMVFASAPVERLLGSRGGDYVAFASDDSLWVASTATPAIKVEPGGYSARWHRGGVLSYTAREAGNDVTAIVAPPALPRLLDTLMENPGVSSDGRLIAFVRSGALVIERTDGTPVVGPITGSFHSMTFAPENESLYATTDAGELTSIRLDGVVATLGSGSVPYGSSSHVMSAIASDGKTVLVRDSVGLAELTVATQEKRYIATNDGRWYAASASYVDDSTILYVIHTQLRPGDALDLQAEAALERGGESHVLVSSRGDAPCYGSSRIGDNALLLQCAGYAQIFELHPPRLLGKAPAVDILGLQSDGTSAFITDGAGTVSQLFDDGTSSSVARVATGYRTGAYTQQ